ncbi:MAG: hypothetical protein ACREN6_13745 [Gemmatimonadaceae bacterium]
MRSHTSKLLLCVRNAGYEASLERRKIYEAVPDRDASAHGLVRVTDGSGEEYFYPAAFFTPVKRAPAKALRGFVRGINTTVPRARDRV